MERITVREALRRASSFLRQHSNIDEPRLTAEILLRHTLGMTRARFFASLQDPLEDHAWETFMEAVNRRVNGEPIQYITGEQDFDGLSMSVNKAVLIPRPETELLVEHVSRLIDDMEHPDSPTLVDIGTGSGAIAISLAVRHPRLHVMAVDISEEALRMARQNAARHGVEQRITFLRGDLLQPLIDKKQAVDIVVSNPPYIPTREIEKLDSHVKDAEPVLALDGGEDGLDCYRTIAVHLRQTLRPSGLVAFEVGIGQAWEVRRILLNQANMEQVEIFEDFAGIERMVIARARA